MKSFTKRAFFPEGAFNVRVGASESAKSEDSDESTPVLEVVVQGTDQSHFTPPSASKKHPTSSSSSSTSSSSRALFTFPSKWDDAEKWLKSSTSTSSKSGANSSKKQTGFRKLHHQQQAQSYPQEGEQTEEELETEDKEKKMMIDSSANGGEVPVVVSRFSFPMVEKSSNTGPADTASEEKKRAQTGQLRIQKPSTDLSEVQTCFDFKQQQPKSPTSLYESVACIAPGGQRSIAMRDMGTEMTPIASQEPSRTGTPLRTPTMVSPRVSPGKLRPIPPPPPVATTTVSDQSSASAPAAATTDERPEEPPLVSVASGSNPASTSATPNLKNPITIRGLNSTRQEIRVLGAQLGKSNIAAWATREEEDEDASKSLKVVQHTGQGVDSAKPSVDLVEVRRSMVESRAAAWEEAEHAKYMARFEREEAKILAWENHQKAKAEAELRKMEVKVEKMRSHAHERLMNKLAAARRRAEELRAVAEAKRGEKAAKTVERAEEIRRTGRVTSSSPTHFIRCCLAGV